MLNANPSPMNFDSAPNLGFGSTAPSVALRPLLKRRAPAPHPRPAALPKPQKKNHIIDIVLADALGNAIAFTQVELLFADGKRLSLRTNEWGAIYVDRLSHGGTFTVQFPEIPAGGNA
jgi:hypothetical protein